MKRTQRMITFFVSVSILITMAASANVAYASSAANGHQDPPRVANKTQATAAFRDGAPYLWSLADEHSESNTQNLFVDLHILHELRTNTVLWSWGWCTKTAWQLEENWKKIRLSYVVNGENVGLHNFSTRDQDDEFEIPGLGTVQGKCRSAYGALYDWPAGDHELTVEAYFNEDVNDGWDVYPAGTIFRDDYRVTVPQNFDSKPVGIEYLGDANYACYYIQGSNGYQLAEQMNRLGPDTEYTEAWGKAGIINVDYSGGACYADGTVDLADFRVNVSTLITMPCWYPPAGASPTEIAKFDNLMWHMARHELRHVEIIEQHVRILEQRLKNSNTCNDDIWEEIADQVWEDEDAAQEAFHASAAGKTIPYP